MKASDLIKELQTLIAVHGDLDVTVYDHDEREQYQFGGIEHCTEGDHGEVIEPSFEISHTGYGDF